MTLFILCGILSNEIIHLMEHFNLMWNFIECFISSNASFIKCFISWNATSNQMLHFIKFFTSSKASFIKWMSAAFSFIKCYISSAGAFLWPIHIVGILSFGHFKHFYHLKDLINFDISSNEIFLQRFFWNFLHENDHTVSAKVKRSLA